MLGALTSHLVCRLVGSAPALPSPASQSAKPASQPAGAVAKRSLNRGLIAPFPSFPPDYQVRFPGYAVC